MSSPTPHDIECDVLTYRHFSAPTTMPAQRTIPNDFFKYRTAPYSGSGSSGKPSTNGSGITFNPESEPLEAPGPYPLPNKELARSDPLHHYIIRTGHFKGKTLIQVNAENPTYLS
jgi:hypothetical protein